MKTMLKGSAQFLVIPINFQDPRDGQQLLEDPEDFAASPDGWNTGSTGTSCVQWLLVIPVSRLY